MRKKRAWWITRGVKKFQRSTVTRCGEFVSIAMGSEGLRQFCVPGSLSTIEADIWLATID
jgi:hypothetical protein